MRAVRIGLLVLASVALVGAVIASLADPRLAAAWGRAFARKNPAPRTSPDRPADAPRVPLFGTRFLDDSGYEAAGLYTRDSEQLSLEEIRKQIRSRPDTGRAALLAQLERFDSSASGRSDRDVRRAGIQAKIALLYMYEGRFADADQWLKRTIDENPGVPADLKANLGALRGMAALRRGEVENCVACVGPSSCIFPIAPRRGTSRPPARVQQSATSPTTSGNGLKTLECAGC